MRVRWHVALCCSEVRRCLKKIHSSATDNACEDVSTRNTTRRIQKYHQKKKAPELPGDSKFSSICTYIANLDTPESCVSDPEGFATSAEYRGRVRNPVARFKFLTFSGGVITHAGLCPMFFIGQLQLKPFRLGKIFMKRHQLERGDNLKGFSFQEGPQNLVDLLRGLLRSLRKLY